MVHLFLAMRMVKHLSSDVDEKIQQYMDAFTRLKSQFTEGAIVNAEIVVIRILDQVNKLGEQVQDSGE